MQLCLSGYLFEDNYASLSLDFPAFCGVAKASGYDGVELRQTQVNVETPYKERARLLNVVRDHGLFVSGLTARGLPGDEPGRTDGFRRYLALCSALDCRLLKIGSPDLAWLRAAAEAAQDREVVLATNNHIGGPLETVAGTRAALAGVGHANYGLLYDAFHLAAKGEDYLGCIPDFAGQTKNILLHPGRPARVDEYAAVVIGDPGWVRARPDEAGAQDWPAVFRAFCGQGYDGLITFFDNGAPAADREALARHAARLVRAWWAPIRGAG